MSLLLKVIDLDLPDSATLLILSGSPMTVNGLCLKLLFIKNVNKNNR